jgi:hypothetical protein
MKEPVGHDWQLLELAPEQVSQLGSHCVQLSPEPVPKEPAGHWIPLPLVVGTAIHFVLSFCDLVKPVPHDRQSPVPSEQDVHPTEHDLHCPSVFKKNPCEHDAHCVPFDAVCANPGEHEH